MLTGHPEGWVNFIKRGVILTEHNIADATAAEQRSAEEPPQETAAQAAYQKKEEEKEALFADFEHQLQVSAYEGSPLTHCSALAAENAALEFARLKSHGLSLILELQGYSELDRGEGKGYILGGVNEEPLRKIDYYVYNRHHNRTRSYYRQGRRLKKIKDTVWLTQVLAQEDSQPESHIVSWCWSELDHISAINQERSKKKFWSVSVAALAVLSLIGFIFGVDFYSVLFFCFMCLYGLLLFRLTLIPFRLLITTIANIVTQRRRRNNSRPGYHIWEKAQAQAGEISIGMVEHVALALAAQRIYESSRPDDRFYNIINVRYADVPCFTAFEQTTEGFRLGVDLYVTNTVVELGKIRLKREVLSVQLEHSGLLTPEEAFQKDAFGQWSLLDLQRQSKNSL